LGDHAEKYLESRRAWSIVRSLLRAPRPAPPRSRIAPPVSDARERRFIVRTVTNETHARFAQHPELTRISQKGGDARPRHPTKRTPMLGADLAGYTEGYGRYFDEHAPAPRSQDHSRSGAAASLLDPAFGLAAAGRTAKDAAVVAEIYDHTIDVILRSEALADSSPAAKDIFDVEYWTSSRQNSREAARPCLSPARSRSSPALLPGSARRRSRRFLVRGAAVVGLDWTRRIESLHNRDDFLGVSCDVTDETQVRSAIEKAVLTFGGLDMLVLNAASFRQATRSQILPTEEWRKAMSVNLDANLVLMRTCTRC